MKSKFMLLLCFWIRLLSNPNCWIRNGLTNRKWDRKLSKELDNPTFIRVDKWTVKLNGVEIWVRNYPYEYGYDYIGKNKGLPSRATVFRFMDALKQSEKEKT